MVDDSGGKWWLYMFLGSYYYTIDEKGRIVIPVKLRADLGNEFILTCDLDGCLSLYPKASWNVIIAKYKEYGLIE